MQTLPRVDVLLSILNATDVGTLDSIAAKIEQVGDELLVMDEPELAARAREAVCALRRGDLTSFKRSRAYLQSKIGHLRG